MTLVPTAFLDAIDRYGARLRSLKYGVRLFVIVLIFILQMHSASINVDLSIHLDPVYLHIMCFMLSMLGNRSDAQANKPERQRQGVQQSRPKPKR
jgi:hypothetical protein